MESYRQYYVQYAAQTMKEGRFMDFQELFRSSPRDLPDEKVSLFYLQSFSIIYFLLSEYDNRNFRQMCGFLKDGYPFEDALQKAYVVFRKPGSFEKAWKEYWLQR